MKTITKFAALAATWVLVGCHRPVSNPETLTAVRAEAQALMTTHTPEQPGNWRTVPKPQWPSVVASLRPEDVTVYPWGVDVTIKSGFDGGWGYQVPRRKSDLPMPAACYLQPSEGVFWHAPC